MGWTYEVDLSDGTTPEMARSQLAQLWGASFDQDAEVIHTGEVDIRIESLLPGDDFDLAIDFFGPSDVVIRLADLLPAVFPRVSAGMWS